MSPDKLKKYAKLKIRMLEENDTLPDERRRTREQIERIAREAVKSGRVNSSGFIVEH